MPYYSYGSRFCLSIALRWVPFHRTLFWLRDTLNMQSKTKIQLKSHNSSRHSSTQSIKKSFFLFLSLFRMPFDHKTAKDVPWAPFYAMNIKAGQHDIVRYYTRRKQYIRDIPSKWCRCVFVWSTTGTNEFNKNVELFSSSFVLCIYLWHRSDRSNEVYICIKSW